jgi:hypothetical protein
MLRSPPFAIGLPTSKRARTKSPRFDPNPADLEATKREDAAFRSGGQRGDREVVDEVAGFGRERAPPPLRAFLRST